MRRLAASCTHHPLNGSLIVHNFAIMQQEVVKQKASFDNHVGILQLTLDSNGQNQPLPNQDAKSTFDINPGMRLPEIDRTFHIYLAMVPASCGGWQTQRHP
jgi:hypothetical protein